VPAGRQTIGCPWAAAPVHGYAGRVRHRLPSIHLAAVLALIALIAACGGAEVPVVSFDPAGACTADGRMPGAYPDLEARLPATYANAAPDNVDSGRHCTAGALGTLADAGIDEVRYAGSTWDLDGSAALTVAVFEADGLTTDAMIEFYKAGALANRKTERLADGGTTVAGVPGRRLDVLQSDGAAQTIVAWPGETPGLVNVLLAADLGDGRVLEALDAIAGS
jgi:hypothetical protein